MTIKEEIERAFVEELVAGVRDERRNLFLALYGDPKPNEARAIEHFTNGMRDQIATHVRASAIAARLIPPPDDNPTPPKDM